MRRKFKPGDRIYEDFEGDGNVSKSKLLYCENCERWILPPYIHTCHCAKDVRESKKKQKEGNK